MSSYVYRNMRLGLYQDGTNSTSAINKAFRAPTKSAQQIVFRTPTPTTKPLEGGDLEAGNIWKAEGELEGTVPRNSKGDQTEKTVGI